MTFLPFLKERSPSRTINPTQFVSNKLEIPGPKFQVGDRVKHRYICDDSLDIERYLKLQTSYGVVLWIIPNVTLSRWELCVLWDDQNPKYFDSYSTHWSGGEDLEFV
ncbi:hypothetical protein L2E81_25080 [Planktothrix agardhii 1033]|nr:hypothetical protein [Planktothrix agardhii 1033]